MVLSQINVHYYNYYYLAVEKALLFLDKDELPPHWDRDLLFGVDKNYIAADSEIFDNDVSIKK